jgi:hypothetical protein
MTTDFKENKVEVGQTTKGIWYCLEITINSDEISNSIEKCNIAMARMNRILANRNRNTQPQKTLKKEEKGEEVENQ